MSPKDLRYMYMYMYMYMHMYMYIYIYIYMYIHIHIHYHYIHVHMHTHIHIRSTFGPACWPPNITPATSNTTLATLIDTPTPEHFWACPLASKYYACHVKYHACHADSPETAAYSLLGVQGGQFVP